ncbi:disease resistance protein RGA5-like [Panicum virgatum]|uniref:Uncharacterized protein n=1 Tax=Panicum virgatum TaxID=38727 RepID=A0A8T0P661_PANVG|nr:disease resistance protein RGA5-like [Panicum virgatum]KAG2555672.1 hypothetical protein PVAP13_8NG036100 [Panicum virgatum]KAG2555673.1 hypothetical protein PVAP13_8NG036100 [Panicum virgatum]
MASVLMGSMNSLLDKLAVLMDEEHFKFSNMSKELSLIRDELSAMNAFLEILADKEELDPLTKNWKNQVREMAYDIEDSIDEVMRHVSQDGNTAGLIWNIIQHFNMLRTKNRISNEIQQIKTRVMEVNHRHKRYKIDASISTSKYVAVDPRLHAIYADEDGLEGTDGPRNELVELLLREDQRLRVVSVVGIGGLGKTTLANEVYKRIGDKFDCQAFVSVSQRPDMTKILANMFSQLGQEPPSQTSEVQNLINDLRKHLQGKRYFVILDDIWDKSAWDILRCALPKNEQASRVITTTRIETVAIACCSYPHDYVYKMEPLDDQQSKKLFLKRIFGSEDVCPEQLREVSTEILGKCNGLPLAIVSISSLLANQAITRVEQWEHVRNSLANKFGKCSALDSMRRILQLSYKNLPYYLKACFLYLGIYPEDYTVRKNDVIRQWIAEGFVSKVQEQDAEDVASNYFNELVNRSMILPNDVNYQNEVLSCKVHDMMLDFILSECAEENFLTINDKSNSSLGMHNNVRRLSIQYDNVNHSMVAPPTNLSHVRSIAAFGGSNFLHVHPLSEFSFLRVLIVDFSDVSYKMELDFTGVCKLFQLRYLKIETNIHVQLQLPEQIGKLQQLQTLDIEWGSVVIPSDIICLPRLIHLIIPESTRLPDGIGNMKALATLQYFDLGENSVENIRGLSQLTNLRDLKLCYSGTSISDKALRMDALRSSLEMLCNLKYLYMYWPGICGSGLSLLNPSPRHLQTLEMTYWCFPKVPNWIGELRKLQVLKIGIRELSMDGFLLLARLPALTNLGLRTQVSPRESITICGMAFAALKYFKYWCRTPRLIFEAGAMPNLERLKLRFKEISESPSGIEHLLGLKEIFLEIGGVRGKVPKRGGALSALITAIDMHPGCPSLKIVSCPHL